MTKTVILRSGVLTYELERKKVKNINLRIRPDGSVHVSANRLMPAALVEQFIRANENAILRAREKYRQRSGKILHPERYADGERLTYMGRTLTLHIVPGGRHRGKISGDVLTLTRTPSDTMQTLNAYCEHFLAGEWEREMDRLCLSYAQSMGGKVPPVPEIRYRKMRSRWGSCRPSEGIVTFNTALLYTPVECMEYVAVHELCHFIHADHSGKFYDSVASLLPDWERRRRLLREYEADILT